MTQVARDKNAPFKSGFIALVGRPSVGKSSLINAIMHRHVAITSRVSQTTRKRLRAILTTPFAQLIFVDTPGLHKPQDALGEKLNSVALYEAQDADITLFLLDVTQPFGRGDAWALKELAKRAASHPLCLVVTKADLAEKEEVSAHAKKECKEPVPTEMERLDTAHVRDRALGEDAIESQVRLAEEALAKEGAHFAATYVVSVKEPASISELLRGLEEMLPEGPRWFSAEETIDAGEEEITAEFIREQVLLSCREELPHATGVLVEEFVWRSKDLCHIDATILVERKSQKAIILGKGGAMIKRIGTGARKALETYLDVRVHLSLHVEVAKKWREDERILRQLGYAD